MSCGRSCRNWGSARPFDWSDIGRFPRQDEGDFRGRTALDQDEAVALRKEKYEICCGLFHRFDRSAWANGTAAQRRALLPAAQEHILAQPDGKDRLVRAVRELSQAFALAVPHEAALAIPTTWPSSRQCNPCSPSAPGEARADEELEHAVRQLVTKRSWRSDGPRLPESFGRN